MLGFIGDCYPMKLSKRSEYGLRALLDLAKGERDTPVSLKELADRNNLPFKFMEHIFLSLRNAGIVLSHAGTRGGYTLSRHAGEIFLGEVIRTLDGTIAPVSCTSKIAYEPCTCPDESTCPLRLAMDQVRDAIVKVVDNTSLADVVSQAKHGG
jgi:Rrf2 family cysteine metabolism transcriptional repressor